jgi:formylglycine-generating enzyme required for sulfatase activity
MLTWTPGTLLLDNYRIEEFIGRGTFAEVYRVTYLPFNQARALKVLTLENSGLSTRERADAEQRFRREYMLGGQLNSPKPHPHLLLVYEPLLAEDLLGVAMEYAPGGSLKNRIEASVMQDRPLSIESCLASGRDIALGLGRLHKFDIVHRDLKPANILFDQDDRARVGDLGLVQTLEDWSDRLEKSNPVPHPGTPAYKSPEQVESLEPLKTSSDVYALGVVLFEMLTGRKYALQRKQIRARELRKDVPAEVEALLMRMLAVDPDERPNDGIEVAGLLEELLQPLVTGRADDERQRAEAQALAQREQAARQQAAAEERSRREAEEKARREALEFARLEAEEQDRRDEEVRQQALAAERARVAEETQTRRDAQRNKNNLDLALAPDVLMKFVRVPAGEFTMGSDKKEDERPQHKLNQPEYLIGKFPVTNQQYYLYTQSTGRSWNFPEGQEQYPAVGITWFDASSFCEWLGRKSGVEVRLPTEAEWEKAARGTDAREYPWGNQQRSPAYDAGDTNTTMPVGKNPHGDSPYGCSDMAGNIWEWVNSLYRPYPYSAVDGRERANSDERRVLRGSWDIHDYSVRCADRDSGDPHVSYDIVGFRCARPS